MGVLCLYFYNVVTLKYLEERKEMIAAQVAEKKEWTTTLQSLLDRYDRRAEALAISNGELRGEIIAMRMQITEMKNDFARRTGKDDQR